MTAWSKFRAQRTTVDGIHFPSKLESEVYSHLKLMVKMGNYTNLRMQERVDPKACEHCGYKPPSVKVDFCVTNKLGQEEFHEAKGLELPRWKEFVKWWKKARPARLVIWKKSGQKLFVSEEIA